MTMMMAKIIYFESSVSFDTQPFPMKKVVPHTGTLHCFLFLTPFTD